MAKLKVGMWLPTYAWEDAGPDHVRRIGESIKKCEEYGLDIWVIDHLLSAPGLYGVAWLEPLNTLAYAAALTRRVRIATGILVLPVRHPVVLAHAVASLDRISEGRLILGIGIGADTPPTRREFEACGVPFSRRVGRTEETIEICRKLWRSDRVSYQGKHFALEDQTLEPKPHRPGGPPFWIGGGADGALRRAARLGEGWFPIGPSAEAFNAFFLDNSEQLPLGLERKLAHPVQVDRALAGQLESARPHGDRVGEGATLVPEQLRVHQRGRQRRTVDHDERVSPPVPAGMQLPRHRVLARPRFARDQDVRVGAREAPDLFGDSPHRAAARHKAFGRHGYQRRRSLSGPPPARHSPTVARARRRGACPVRTRER